jgi:hypothetical protein
VVAAMKWLILRRLKKMAESFSEKAICSNCLHFENGCCTQRNKSGERVFNKKTNEWESAKDYEKTSPDSSCNLFTDVAETAKIEVKMAYDTIKELIQKYLDIKPKYIPIIALWILGTYVYKNFETFPYLYINAMKSSGKTRLLKLISALSHNGQLLASVTEAIIFRTTGTLAVDEFENIGAKGKEALKDLLNTAYKKGIKVKRTRKAKGIAGESYEVDEFDTYRPIAIANISGMEEVLNDRCIPILLEKSKDPIKVKILEDFTTNPAIKQVICNLLRFWCMKCVYVGSKTMYEAWNDYIIHTYTNYIHYTTYTTYTPDINEKVFKKIMESGIDGRYLELFFPLFLIALNIDEKIFDEILGIAKEMVDEKKNDEIIESKDVLLYNFVAQMAYNAEFINVSEMVRRFKDYIGEAGDWLNSEWMGRALKRLGLIVQKRRVGRGIDVVINQIKAIEKSGMFKPDEKKEEVKDFQEIL